MLREKRLVLERSFEETVANRLAQELNSSPVLGRLLLKKGVESFEGARHFFRPKLEQLHDPFLMKDMAKAIDRMEQSISDKEKILIYGDYDVDGTTAFFIVHLFFQRYYYELDFHIPDRYMVDYVIFRNVFEI